jgi:ParB family transcriptional regulator, chromosome partitioning protein
MKEPTLLRIARIPLADIDRGSRLRPASEAGIESIVASVRELGVMKDPIHVRQTRRGLSLIAGLHRLEAAPRLGWSDIEAKVWTDVTDDWARLMEIDDNLAGAELNALDTAVFLATRKTVYERLHPETKRGVAGAKGRWDATEPSSVAFVQATAGKFGMTERQIYKIVAAGSKLSPKDTQLLRASPRQVTLKDLSVIAKVGNSAERYSVVAALSEGKAKSAADARRQYSAANGGPQPAPKDAVEEAFKTLSAAWARAGAVARRRFVEAHFEELGRMGADEEERRFEAEKPALLAEIAATEAAE